MSDIERRDAQGEDERALRGALKQIRDYPGTSRAADYMRRIAREALRSRPAKPFLEENVDRWLDGEATGLVNALWAKIDESYADRNGNGETERVVRESHEIAKQWLIETFADLRAALRSRLAEPASSTATTKAEALAAHGYLANSDDVGRVAHLLEQMEPAPECPYCGPDGTLRHGDSERICPDCGGTHETKLEPAQAAPSEEDSRFHISQAQAAEWHTQLVEEENENKRLRAALVSERAKRGSCGACSGPDESPLCTNCPDVESPAPDATALRARVLVACIETESALARHEVEHGDGWLYNHADVIRGYKTELEALLRSEPREENKKEEL